uniref:Uncharacterized protein n=1 Tax=Arion vulgaris TaxID=1028688 RepID=A0A0B7BJD8_9EUPU
MDDLRSPPRDGRHGHDQNKIKLERDIMIGFNDFSKIVEVMRMVAHANNMTETLIVDFIKFRDFMAHKGVDSLDIVFVQMVNAFVMYCRRILEFPIVSHEPKSTGSMSKTFPRMADINVLVCAKWFLNMHNNKAIKISIIIRWMQKLVVGSSFSDRTFAVEGEDIFVTYKNKKEPFDISWVDTLTKIVQNSQVSYTEAEEQLLKELHSTATELLMN